MTRLKVGEVGPDSIRINGKPVDELTFVEAAHTKPQMKGVRETARQNKIDNIRAGAPTQRVLYLVGRITECEENIRRVRALIGRENATISEYTGLISLCNFRDKELGRIAADDPDRIALIKDLKKRFPPYNVVAMEQQITQSQEAIGRADLVISQEYTSISELEAVKALCIKRDNDLRSLGVTIA